MSSSMELLMLPAVPYRKLQCLFRLGDEHRRTGKSTICASAASSRMCRGAGRAAPEIRRKEIM
jgi:hypothetical protein